MRQKLRIVLLSLVVGFPASALAVTTDDFQVKDTQSLINLCTASQNDPLAGEAIHFCHGYLVGAFHYYKVTHASPDSKQLFCFPDPPPSRDEAIGQFVSWAKAHPQYMNDAPVETEFRFLIETWPCK